MFTVVRDDRLVQITLASNPSFVQPLLKRFEDIAREWGIDNAGRILIVLRELLFNDIVHGNNSRQSRVVRCSIERIPGGVFRIAVEDEGDGFDFTCMDMSFPEDPRRVHRRGYILIRKICRQIEFNAQGNRVTVLVDAADRGEEG